MKTFQEFAVEAYRGEYDRRGPRPVRGRDYDDKGYGTGNLGGKFQGGWLEKEKAAKPKKKSAAERMDAAGKKLGLPEEVVDEGIGMTMANALGNPPTLSKRMKLKRALIVREIEKNTEKNKKKKLKYLLDEWGSDLQSEHERFLVEKHFKSPVIIYDYPSKIKAFYMRLNDDDKTVRAMDVLFPGIGEIIGGSQREERLDVLKKRMSEMGIEEKELWWYLDLRKYGTVPHSGFGLGFERMVMFCTGMSNIRDVIPYPRTPKNASF